MKTYVASIRAEFESASGRVVGYRRRAPFILIVALVLLLASGCGGGGAGSQSPSQSSGSGGGGSNSGGGGNGGGTTGSTVVLVNLGDYAAVPGALTADRILSFELTIEAVALRSSDGDISLLSAPRRFELSHLSLKSEPLLVGKIARGSYNGVAIRVSNPEISFLDSNGILHENVAASLASTTIIIDHPLSIGANPIVVNLVPLASSISFDAGNNITVIPQFSAGDVSVSQNGMQVFDDLLGRVMSVGGSSFTLDLGNGSLTLAADSSTVGGLSTGLTVDVGGGLWADGTLSASCFTPCGSAIDIESDDSSAAAVEGLVLATSLTQLQMLVREVHGAHDVTLPAVGGALTVNADAATQFGLDADGINLEDLDFAPTFDALTITPGQNVRAVATSGSATSVTATQLKLAKQSLNGTGGAVTAGAVTGQYSFPLNLNADSAFAQFTGHTSVVVTAEAGAFAIGDPFAPCVTCVVGQPVRVRGLVFFSGGQYRLVANHVALN